MQLFPQHIRTICHPLLVSILSPINQKQWCHRWIWATYEKCVVVFLLKDSNRSNYLVKFFLNNLVGKCYFCLFCTGICDLLFRKEHKGGRSRENAQIMLEITQLLQFTLQAVTASTMFQHAELVLTTLWGTFIHMFVTLGSACRDPKVKWTSNVKGTVITIDESSNIDAETSLTKRYSALRPGNKKKENMHSIFTSKLFGPKLSQHLLLYLLFFTLHR